MLALQNAMQLEGMYLGIDKASGVVVSATRESCFCSAEQITVQGKTGTAENTGSSAKSLKSFGRTAVRLLTGPRRTV